MPCTCLQEGLFIGAAVTQATLIDYLLSAGSKAQHQDKPQTNGTKASKNVPQTGTIGVYTALAHHLQRIAGNPVPSIFLSTHHASDSPVSHYTMLEGCAAWQGFTHTPLLAPQSTLCNCNFFFQLKHSVLPFQSMPQAVFVYSNNTTCHI